MRVRYLGAAAAAVLALTGLAGCKTNIGTAAIIDGHKVTESDINHYLTPDAQPVTQQNQSTGGSTQVSPRSFVMSTLINERLGFKLMALIPSVSGITESQLDAQLQNDLAGKTPRQVAEQGGLHGYTDDFYKILLRVRELVFVVQQQPGNVVQRAFSKVNFPVYVAPRYGQWDSKQLLFTAGSALPGYLEVQPGSASQPGLPGAS